jgi:hypothetical protein
VVLKLRVAHEPDVGSLSDRCAPHGLLRLHVAVREALIETYLFGWRQCLIWKNQHCVLEPRGPHTLPLPVVQTRYIHSCYSRTELSAVGKLDDWGDLDLLDWFDRCSWRCTNLRI